MAHIWRFSHERFYGFLPSRNVESERTWATLKADLPRSVYHVEAFRQSGVQLIGRVVHVIYESWHNKLEAQHARLCDFNAFCHAFRLRKHNVIIEVVWHLPAVFRVCFLDVNAEEVGLVREPLVHIVEAPGLVTKRRSGVAAEYQSNRLVPMIGQSTHFAGGGYRFHPATPD